ncbi:peptidase M20, partial [Bosea sp. CER48]
IENFNRRARCYAKMLRTRERTTPSAALVSAGELLERVERVCGREALARVRHTEKAWRDSDDPLAQTRAVVSAMATEAGLVGPTIVYGFSSLVYPATHLARGDDPAGFAAAIEDARRCHEETRRPAIKYREYFTGISDMSFLGHRPLDADQDQIAANTPIASLVDRAGADTLVFPVVNIGPWGREFHQRLERVYMPYAFEELPRFLREIARRFLG